MATFVVINEENKVVNLIELNAHKVVLAKENAVMNATYDPVTDTFTLPPPPEEGE